MQDDFTPEAMVLAAAMLDCSPKWIHLVSPGQQRKMVTDPEITSKNWHTIESIAFAHKMSGETFLILVDLLAEKNQVGRRTPRQVLDVISGKLRALDPNAAPG